MERQAPGGVRPAAGGGGVARADGERPDAQARHLEDVMLRIRLAEGIEPALLGDVDRFIEAGWLEPVGDRVVLTRSGRLMADRVVLEAVGGE